MTVPAEDYGLVIWIECVGLAFGLAMLGALLYVVTWPIVWVIRLVKPDFPYPLALLERVAERWLRFQDSNEGRRSDVEAIKRRMG